MLRNYWLWKSKNSRLYGIVLMYHHVTDEYVDIDKSCRCTIQEFCNSINDIIQQGYQFVSIDEFYDIVNNHKENKFALMTFDDVPENFYFNAYPILKENNIPFTLFITRKFIDTKGFLKTSQIEELNEDTLCTIGAHTLTHPMLRKVENSYEEIKKSKEILEKILCKPIDYFAYPYGRQSAVSRRVMREVEKAGFKCAFGTIQVPISDCLKKHIYYLPRMIYKGGGLEMYNKFHFYCLELLLKKMNKNLLVWVNCLIYAKGSSL